MEGNHAVTKPILDSYKRPGAMTSGGKHADMLGRLPNVRPRPHRARSNSA
jgi:hypothetical protein